LDIGPGDEVIISDFTHPATGNIVQWIGATPVLVDVDPSTYNIDPNQTKKAITRKTRCIVPVSWGGNPLDMKPLNELGRKHNLHIIEDAACSLGARFHNQKTGTMADITCFSFHPRKVITCGEGGMAVTDNPTYADRLAKLKFFGIQTKNGRIEFVQWGTNSKLSNIASAIGVEQMKKIDTIINRRIELAGNYDRLLADIEGVRTPQRRNNTRHTYQTYAVYIEKPDERDKIIEDLKKKNIETQIGTYALHLQPAYRKVRKIAKLENAEQLYKNLLALPMCHTMTQQDQQRVVSEIKKSLQAA